MSKLEALAKLPGSARIEMSVDELRSFLLEARTEGGPLVLSTRQAQTELGPSEKTWLKWAAKGDVWAEVDGERVEAFQEIAGGRWRLPRVACEAHLARLRNKSALRSRGFRGPRSQTFKKAG